jgi:formamidopyrimidine-DNA glycosylase
MPELPEIESLRRALGKSLVSRTIRSVEIDRPKLFVPAAGLSVEDLCGATVTELRRRGKLLIWGLSNGLSLVVHLKLDGQFVHLDGSGAELAHGGHPVPKWGTPLPHKATHVTFRLDDGSTLYLTDIRQFGRLWLMPAADVDAFVARQQLSPEPLTPQFTARRLGERLARRSLPLKTVLLDQKVVGGLGNIYADEALWRARLNPKRPANSLDAAEVRRLHRAIRWVFGYALREGVASVLQGKASPQRAFPYAHGRDGSPCPRCGTTFVKEWVGGRGTSYCPGCQKPD